MSRVIHLHVHDARVTAVKKTSVTKPKGAGSVKPAKPNTGPKPPKPPKSTPNSKPPSQTKSSGVSVTGAATSVAQGVTHAVGGLNKVQSIAERLQKPV